MLRECHRVLRSGGRIAGYVIHTPPGLSASDLERAAELGPEDVTAPASPADLARETGFVDVATTDVTQEYGTTVNAMIDASAQWEAELRAEQGDAEYDAGRERGEALRAGIREGLLRRSLVVAVKP